MNVKQGPDLYRITEGSIETTLRWLRFELQRLDGLIERRKQVITEDAEIMAANSRGMAEYVRRRRRIKVAIDALERVY